MSEGNERNLESIAPEAAENIQQNDEIEKLAEPAAEEPVAVEPADIPELDDDRENAPRKSEPSKKDGKDKKKKKRGKKNAVLPLVIALVGVLVILAVLVGYGLGRVGSGRVEPEESVEEPADPMDQAEIQAYDAFMEELTGENQQALDALAGADSYFDEGADALRGENGMLDEDALDGANAGEPVVVAEYGDGQQLMSDEVLEEYSEQLSTYILSGYSEEEIAETLLDDVLQTMVNERILAAHAQELGVYELNDEDRAEIEAQAAATYAEYVAYYRNNVVSTAGMSDEEADAAVKEYLLDFEGVNYESLVNEIGGSWWEQKLYDRITADVTVDDAAVRADYVQRVEEQKQDFTESPDDYEFTQMNGEIIVYNLPGYRSVKMLLLGFADDEAAMSVYALQDELASLEAEGDAENQTEHKAELDEYYAEPEARAKEALEQLRAGADMDEMILSIGADEGMRNERLREQGYYVSSESLLRPVEFIEAAMALENVGDYSEPVRTEEGVCILQYLGDVSEGEVPLADVRDALADEALDAARYDAYAKQVEAWLDEANPSYYPERMQ